MAKNNEKLPLVGGGVFTKDGGVNNITLLKMGLF